MMDLLGWKGLFEDESGSGKWYTYAVKARHDPLLSGILLLSEMNLSSTKFLYHFTPPLLTERVPRIYYVAIQRSHSRFAVL